jgi:hypothetical protein
MSKPNDIKKLDEHMKLSFKSKLTKFVLGLSLITAHPAGALEIESDVEYLASPKTTIKALHRLFVGVPVGGNFSFGQSIYSGAHGDGGGAFFWGFEGVKRFSTSQKTNLALSAFFGGGGGASQVVGDGTMYRFGATGEYNLTSNWSARAGVSYLSISGAPIDDWATSVGLRYHLTPKSKISNSGKLNLARASFRTSRLQFPSSLARSGTSQKPLTLVGAEASFSILNDYETFLGADGAVSGGDGYMQVMGGLRKLWPVGPVSLLAQSSIGFGGVGDVDTGGGLIAGASAGIAIPVGTDFNVELTYGTLNALSTNVSGTGAQLSLSRVFGREGERTTQTEQQQWQVGLGLSTQEPNPSYMKSGSNAGIQPVMQESSIDYFLSDNVYLTGNAQTTVSGGVAGYAVGLLGVGREFAVGDQWRLSLEAHVGAAGGGGVDVGNGLLGGARVELDYMLTPTNAVSVGFGVLKSFDGGMNAPVVHLGYKHRFTTN